MNQKFKRVSKSQAGFTLIELLIAISLLSIITTSFLGILINNIQLSKKFEIKTKAINLLKVRLEEELTKNFNDIVTIPKQKFNNELADYYYSIRVKNFEDEIKQIEGQIYFKDELVDGIITFVVKDL